MLDKAYIESKLKEGRAYERFIDRRFAVAGINIGLYGSRRDQFNIGECKLGIEIKRDGKRKSGNLFIEHDELNRKGNYVPSGPWRKDNSTLYLIGDEKEAWVFDKKTLREYCDAECLLVEVKIEHSKTGEVIITGHGYLLPISDTKGIVIEHIKFEEGDNVRETACLKRIAGLANGGGGASSGPWSGRTEKEPGLQVRHGKEAEAPGRQYGAYPEKKPGGDGGDQGEGQRKIQGEKQMTGVNFDDVREAAKGRWGGIMSHYGIDVGNGKHGPCPMCDGQKSFRFDDQEGRGTWICTHCGSGDGFHLLKNILGWEFANACNEIAPMLGAIKPGTIQPEKTLTADAFRKVLEGSKDITWGTPVWTYLNNRGLELPQNGPVYPERQHLRYHPALYEPETKKEHPAMIAIFRGVDGRGITIHRTYLTKDGYKLDIESPKKVMPTLGGQPMAGGAVQLYPLVDTVLSVAEGIETAIAVRRMQQETPIWACLSTSLMKAFTPPDSVKQVIIWGDNDANFAGQEAAYALAHKLTLKGLIVDVNFPMRTGEDWFDEVVRMSTENLEKVVEATHGV